jgi:hypothetical protein
VIPRRRLIVALVAAVLATLVAAAFAQQFGQDPTWRPRIWIGNGRFYRTPPKWATRENFDGSRTYRRGFYRSDRREAGGSGWDTDIPDTSEREGESREYFDRFSPNGYAVGVNVALYALTH